MVGLIATPIGPKALSAFRVHNAMQTLERSLRDPYKLPAGMHFLERYLALEKRAVHLEAQELFRRARTEQLYRAALDYDNRLALLGKDADGQDAAELKARLWQKVNDVDTDNRRWLKTVLKEIGWFRISVYGRAASNTAWLLVQHGDQDPVWQKQILRDIKPMVAQREVSGIDVAYLEDRIAAGEAKPQIYGTQGFCVDGGWSPLPISHPEQVDQRRKAIGLEPMAEYQKRFRRMCLES
jgi:hypothetical protein